LLYYTIRYNELSNQLSFRTVFEIDLYIVGCYYVLKLSSRLIKIQLTYNHAQNLAAFVGRMLFWWRWALGRYDAFVGGL